MLTLQNLNHKGKPTMLKYFMPKEGQFFNLFNESADQILLGTQEFQKMVNHLDNAAEHAKNIRDIEHKADTITHRTVELLHKTFITPLDREDIHTLISRMDDIVDYIEAASERIHLYNVTDASPEIHAMADVCVRSAELVSKAIRGLENLKKPEELLHLCIEINHLENEGDQILRTAMAKLFREETDTRQLIKLKEIYELLEGVTDRCEDVANIIEGIVLEYA
jgi:predicted phosphate transport protein (TIGR00153 family)